MEDRPVSRVPWVKTGSLPFGNKRLHEVSWWSLMWDVSDRKQSRPDGVATDVAFEILKNRRRRRILKLLERHDERMTLSELAEEIAARENDIDRRNITSDQRKRVYVGLYQQHLPKMDKADVVDYDQRSGETELTDAGRQLWQWRTEKLQEGEDDQDTRWPELYFSIGAASLGLLAAARLQLVPSEEVMMALLSVFLLIAVAHTYRELLQV